MEVTLTLSLYYCISFYLANSHILLLLFIFRFINEEALAYELAGYFFMEFGQKEVSANYFLQAHEKYHEWGAIAKANAVYEFTMTSMGACALGVQ